MASSYSYRTLMFQIQTTVILMALLLCIQPSMSKTSYGSKINFRNSPSSPSMSISPAPAVFPYASASPPSGFPTTAGAPSDIDIPLLPTPAPPSPSSYKPSVLPIIPSNPSPPNPESAASAEPYRRHGFDSLPPIADSDYSVGRLNPCLWLLGFSKLVLMLTAALEFW